MGLTKQYLAYHSVGNFNIIASGNVNVSFITYNKTDGRYVAVGAAEKVFVWDLRLGEKVLEFVRGKEEVTTLCPSPDRLHLAVGFADGVVRIFNLQSTFEDEPQFSLHRSGVNILRYDSAGLRLASGGQDTDIVIIDIVTATGKCRLTGHSGAITDTCFYENTMDNNIVISSSTDKQVKIWNITTQCCFRTIVDYTTEVWAIALLRGGDFLVTGCDDSNINVYRLIPNTQDTQQVGETAVDGSIAEEQIHLPLRCNLVGSIKRADTRGRICNLVSDPSGRVLVFHGTKSKIIETFSFHSKEEAEQRCKKRLKKNSTDDIDVSNVSLTDEIRRLPPVNIKSKLKSIDVLIGGGDSLRIVGTFFNNSIRVFALNLKEKKSEPELLRSLHSQGHSSEVRTICFSSDALAVCSADGDSLKLWNRESMRSVQTISDTGYALCCCFAPGDRHVLIGRMDGVLVIADIVSGEVLEEIPAHQRELWSMALLANGSGIVTAGGDATVKFWSFELIDYVQPKSDEDLNLTSRKVLSLLHKNTLKLEETVQCVGVSKNGKFFAVGLLDSTVKLFFMDTLKFYLALYGHKLSVLSLDISDDSSLIVTGSADRNIKIWGMDFGDCHKSLFAHDDSVMCVKFVPKTHMFWSCGKDGKIKQWDADSFVQIQSVPSHLGQAYCLDVSNTGHYIVSSGSDRTIRLFERSDEPIVLEDMQETEREEIEQQKLATGTDDPIMPGMITPLNLPSRKTVAAEQAVELIMDALEILVNFKQADKGEPIPLLMRAHNAQTPVDLIIAVLSRIKSSDLEESLLLLPFTSVCELLKSLPEIIRNRTDQTELLCKVITFLFRIHRKPIIGNQTLLPFIQQMVIDLEENIDLERDIMGKNLFALKMIQHDIEQDDLENGAELFYDALKAKKKRDQKMKSRQMKKKISIQMVS
ncbi:WD repeat-containing protein 3 [Sitodiplosis mosellana]|uniref:WD repeat-containing protein 3 n=1 Tax=Sitodiplosis mosellana TaxID=263140 RepID=UPI0024439AAE|nr:WD repeat-containing protein 3 [Sitodiplosis mosellana]XP_055305494.1 WD repeat-containing protein 3 [Sitodiplosis mosellana]